MYITRPSEAEDSTLEALKASGFDMVVLTDVKKVATIRERKPPMWQPAIFLIDLYLAGAESSFDLVRRLSEQYQGKKVPILMMSDRITREDELDSSNSGAAGILKKPFGLNEIRAILEKQKIRELKGEIVNEILDIIS